MSKDNELVGQKFGMLTVLELCNTYKGIMCKCLCDCGNEKTVSSKFLRYGKVKSCGCLSSKSKLKDITGQRGGKLIAIKYTGKIKNHSAVWECKCDCGNICEVKTSAFLSGAIRSCGCLRSESRIKDITGQRFGKLTATKRTGQKKNNSQVWECKCDCGNICEVSSGALKSGKTNSCGCLLNESRSKAIKKALETRKDHYIDGTDVYQLSQEPRSNNTSGVVGVCYDTTTKSWKAKIQFKKKKYYLGSSADINVAVKLRKDAEKHLHGEFLDWYYKQKELAKTDKS
ncbi:MAG: AP2 domain-containing protein [Alkaliphilus sp.]|nr:AP2 domain-containing protein [bacterium AH-315-E09]PHS29358.1 MAG: AP2 domain-containing protein [Alkaliphilus sp.]